MGLNEYNFLNMPHTRVCVFANEHFFQQIFLSFFAVAGKFTQRAKHLIYGFECRLQHGLNRKFIIFKFSPFLPVDGDKPNPLFQCVIKLLIKIRYFTLQSFFFRLICMYL